MLNGDLATSNSNRQCQESDFEFLLCVLTRLILYFLFLTSLAYLFEEFTS